MKKLFFVLLLALPVFAQGNFKVDFDFARFHYNDSLGYLEIYYSFYQNQFQQTGTETERNISGRLDIVIRNAADSVIFDKDFQFTSAIDPLDTVVNKGFTGVLNLALPFGEYQCTLSGRDSNNPQSTDEVTFNFEIKKQTNDRFSVSDIELASSIRESDNTSGMFYKNTFEVVPNPANVFSQVLPVVYFYAELYNIDLDQGSEVLRIDHILQNSSEQIYYKKSKFVPRSNSSVVEIGTINVSKAPSGAYTLIVAVTDSIKNLTVYSTKRLFIFNPGIIDTNVYAKDERNIISSEFASMSDEELNEVFGYSSYIATEKEREGWKKLTTEEAKKNFLFDFWKSRDRDSYTPGNEYRRDYFNRVKIANERYSTIQRKGWKTDRGRVFITYGEPSEIERYPNQVDTRPHEIWQYNELEGGVIFIFADLSGFNEYTLIHSNARGELRDDTWRRKIKTY